MANNLPSVKEMLRNNLIAAGVETILPKHIPLDSFTQVAAVAYLKSPDLAKATQDSLMMAFAACAKDGLVPDGKEAHINTYNKNIGTRQNPHYVVVAEYEPMIEGILKRVHASGEVEFITADIVYPEDEFSYYVNDNGVHLHHQPDFDAERNHKRIKLFYAVARLKSGEVKAVVMTRADVERSRASSKAKNGTAWTQWFDRMGLKTVARRLCRHLPKGSEILRSMEKEDDLQNDEIDITPKEKENAIDVPELMSGKEVEQGDFEEIPDNEEDYHGDIEDALMSDSQQDTNESYEYVEDLIMKIGSTDDRQQTISEYKHAAKEMKVCAMSGELTQEQIDQLGAQLNSVYQGIQGQ